MSEFNGRVAIITGSSSGIGEETARRLSALGATVVVNSSSSVEAGEKVAASLPDAVYVRADISDAGDCEALVAAALERFGRLDVLVNNAGVTEVIPHEDLDAVTDEVFRRILDVNVMGTWRLTRLAMPHLKADGGGAVVNVSSIAGIRPLGSSIPYGVSKAALNHMTTMLAKVTGPEVTVNAVAPGLIRTPWTEDWPHHQFVPDLAPAGRSGEPEDVASVVVDLAASGYVTGQVVVIDGGLTLTTT
jgi:ketoreductase RED2